MHKTSANHFKALQRKKEATLQLHNAILSDSSGQVLERIEQGADLTYVRAGKTPIELAACQKKWHIVHTIARHAQTDRIDQKRFGRALLLAAEANRTDVVIALLKCSAKPYNSDNTTKNQALHYAVGHNSTKMVAALLKAGANMLFENKEGVSPLTLAEKDIRTKQLEQMMIDRLATDSKTAQFQPSALITWLKCPTPFSLPKKFEQQKESRFSFLFAQLEKAHLASSESRPNLRTIASSHRQYCFYN